MEYRLNKIDTDIRKRMQEELKTDKIHANEKLNIKKELNRYDKYNRSNYSDENRNMKKKYITIDCIKSSDRLFEVEAERLDILNVDNSNGKTIDTKK